MDPVLITGLVLVGLGAVYAFRAGKSSTPIRKKAPGGKKKGKAPRPQQKAARPPGQGTQGGGQLQPQAPAARQGQQGQAGGGQAASRGQAAGQQGQGALAETGGSGVYFTASTQTGDVDVQRLSAARENRRMVELASRLMDSGDQEAKGLGLAVLKAGAEQYLKGLGFSGQQAQAMMQANGGGSGLSPARQDIAPSEHVEELQPQIMKGRFGRGRS